MPYAAPVPSEYPNQFSVRIRHATQIGDYGVDIICQLSTDNPNDPQAAEVFQDFVDLLGDGGEHFNVVNAVRYTTAREDVTPTS